MSVVEGTVAVSVGRLSSRSMMNHASCSPVKSSALVGSVGSEYSGSVGSVVSGGMVCDGVVPDGVGVAVEVVLAGVSIALAIARRDSA